MTKDSKKKKGWLVISVFSLVIPLLIAPAVFVPNLVISAIFDGHRFTYEEFLLADEGTFFKSRNDFDSLSERKDYFFVSGENELCGHYYEADNPNGTVLVAHGLGQQADGKMALIENYFLNEGWNVFALDLTASGDSEGSSVLGLDQSAYDVANAVDFICKEPTLSTFSDRICLVGYSWGAYGVAASLAYNKAPKALMCLAAYESPDDVMIESATKWMGSLAYATAPLMRTSLYIMRGQKGFLSAVDALNECPDVPVLLAQGNEDTTVPVRCSLWNSAKLIDNQERVYLANNGQLENKTHISIYLNDESAAYLKDSFPDEADALLEEYGSYANIPEEKKDEIKEKTSNLDEELFEQANGIFTKACSGI